MGALNAGGLGYKEDQDVKEAHDAVIRQSARLLAHITDISDITNPPRLSRIKKA